MPHILFADDDDDIRTLVSMALEGQPDLRLTACADAASAQEAFLRDRPDLVVLDLNLPDLPGDRLLSALAAQPGPTPPIVFLTADAQDAEVARLMARGAVGVIAKPFDVLALPDRLRGYIP